MEHDPESLFESSLTPTITHESDAPGLPDSPDSDLCRQVSLPVLVSIMEFELDWRWEGVITPKNFWRKVFEMELGRSFDASGRLRNVSVRDRSTLSIETGEVQAEACIHWRYATHTGVVLEAYMLRGDDPGVECWVVQGGKKNVKGL